MNNNRNVKTFKGRNHLSEMIESEIHKIFNNDITLVEYGVDRVLDLNPEIGDAMKLDSSYDSPTALSLQYLPDYILYDRANNKVYYLDIKHSVTPLKYKHRMRTIQNLNSDINVNVSNVGIIAREAMYAYRRFYPETIILYFSNYNSKVSMAHFVPYIRLLYAFGWDEVTPLDNYVIGTENYFPFSRNSLSQGSRTPHVNIYLDSFLETADFFAGIGIDVNRENLDQLNQMIK